MCSPICGSFLTASTFRGVRSRATSPPWRTGLWTRYAGPSGTSERKTGSGLNRLRSRHLMEQSRPDRTARLVLTGAGGGTFDIPMALDSPVGPPDVLIVADVVDFCRLAARRVRPAALSATIEGDGEQLAELVLPERSPAIDRRELSGFHSGGPEKEPAAV